MRLERSRAQELFRAARVVRLATVTKDGAPHLVPVTTAVIEDRIVFAVDHKPKTTAHLRRLDNIAAVPRVCFLADGYAEDWSALWWVRADAVAQVISSGPEWEAAVNALAAKYAQYQQVRPADAVVSAQVQRWSGWAAAS